MIFGGDWINPTNKYEEVFRNVNAVTISFEPGVLNNSTFKLAGSNIDKVKVTLTRFYIWSDGATTPKYVFPIEDIFIRRKMTLPLLYNFNEMVPREGKINDIVLLTKDILKE